MREPDWEASRIGVYYVRFQIITKIIRKKKKNIKNRLNTFQLTKAVQKPERLATICDYSSRGSETLF